MPDKTASKSTVALLSGCVLLVGGFLLLGIKVCWSQSLLFLIGTGMGICLYHASFGFTGGWRRFIKDGRADGIRAMALLLMLAMLLFFPVLARGQVMGQQVRGSVAPIGLSIIIGAFIFGMGMQLGGGCASGTLCMVGGGATRMLITLSGFIAGAFIATTHLSWWRGLPGLPRISLVQRFGPWTALGLCFVVLLVITVVTSYVEFKKHGKLRPIFRSETEQSVTQRLLRGGWPMAWGAIGLALLNFATLLTAGRPWGISSAFALWGAKGLQSLGIDVTTFSHWSQRSELLALPVFVDINSVMNFGIMIGALLAAGLARDFNPQWDIPMASIIAAVVGGLLLGYGALLAFGCNIGALFSGIASGSLHGWVWMIAGYTGNIVGVRLRPLFSLP